MNIHIDSIHRYPVKSMLGEDLASTLVTQWGIEGDRTGALFDDSTHRLITAKSHGGSDLFKFRAQYREPPADSDDRGALVISLPSGERVHAPSRDLDLKLSSALQRDVRLVVPARRADGNEMLEQSSRFFDKAPIHIMTTASLDELSSTIATGHVSSMRFRPNIVVKTETHSRYPEEEWIGRMLRIGEVVFSVKEPTIRCGVATFAQGELSRDTSLLQHIFKETGGFLGVYADVVRAGRIRVGDRIELV